MITVQETSLEAYEGNFRSTRLQVLDSIKELNKRGTNPCNAEIMDYLNDRILLQKECITDEERWMPNKITGRVNELRGKKHGCKVTFAGKKEYKGKKVMTWKLNDHQEGTMEVEE